MKVAFHLLASIASLVLAWHAHAAPGDLDPSFGTNGVATFRIGSSWETIQAIARQPDGKVVAAASGTGGLLVARYAADGTLDASFGSGGVARVPVAGYGRPRAMVVQDDGTIVVLAECTGAGGEFVDACLFRFQADGTLDESFTRAFGRGFTVAPVLVRQSDEKLLLAGLTPRGFGAIRLLPSGAFDPAFGDNGIAALTPPNPQAIPSTLALQADGRIVLFGAGVAPRAARFHADGTLDTSFAADTGQMIVRASLQQPDGKLLVAGCPVETGDGSRVRVIRLLANGAPDAGFGNVGVSEPFPAVAGCPFSLRLRSDGRIAMGVDPGQWPQSKFRVIQLLASGSVDGTFGNAGLAEFQAGGDADRPFAMLLQPDGKLVLGGDRWGRDLALVRLGTDGTLDPAFGVQGIVNTDFDHGRAGFLRALRIADGHTYVLSHLYEEVSGPLQGDVAVTRLLADGRPDPSYGKGGNAIATFRYPVRGDLSAGGPRAMAVLPDGRVVVGGSSLRFENPQQGRQGAVLRLDANGNPDAAFESAAWNILFWRVSEIHAVEALGDGRIVIAGLLLHGDFSSMDQGVVLRLLPDGSLDPSFNVATFDVERANYLPPVRLRLAVRGDGRMLVSGFAKDALSVVRLQVDGLPDAGFGAAGRAVVSLGTPYPLPFAYAGHYPATTLLHADGRITLTGTSTPAGTCSTQSAPAFHSVLARLTPAGGPAPGLRSSAFGAAFPYVAAARLDPHERIVAAGSYLAGCQGYSMLGAPQHRRIEAPAVVRFTASGTPDVRFGSDGLVRLGGPEQNGATVADVGAQADGKIVAIIDRQRVGVGFQVHRLENSDMPAPEGLAGDSDGDSIPDAVEAVESRDAAWKDNDVFANARLFAMQQYRDFLGREGDAGGVGHWTTELSTGARSRGQVVETFFNSAEFQGLAAPVARLYFAYFLRIPDYGGLNFWISQYRAGNSLEAISDQFAASNEFVNTYGALSSTQFVGRVYQNVLGRQPDPGGLAHWAGQLDGGMTRGQMMVAFSESAEYRTLIANEVYVTMTYVGMLRRAPEPGGFAFWVSYLDAGNSARALIDGFLAAPEYRGRFLP